MREPKSKMQSCGKARIILSDAPGIFRTLENTPKLRDQVPAMIDNLFNFKEGHKAIGEMVAEMAASTTKSLLKSPKQNHHTAKNLGFFMNHIVSGIERNAKTREQMIEKGSSILGFGLKAVEKFSPAQAKPVFENVNKGLDWLKNRDLASVEDAKKHLRSTMYELVDSTFTSIADPYGNLAAGNGEPNEVQNYRDALDVYDSLYWEKR